MELTIFRSRISNTIVVFQNLKLIYLDQFFSVQAFKHLAANLHFSINETAQFFPAFVSPDNIFVFIKCLNRHSGYVTVIVPLLRYDNTGNGPFESSF